MGPYSWNSMLLRGVEDLPCPLPVRPRRTGSPSLRIEEDLAELATSRYQGPVSSSVVAWVPFSVPPVLVDGFFQTLRRRDELRLCCQVRTAHGDLAEFRRMP